MISKNMIKKLLDSGKLKIENFNPQYLESASYDATLGKRGFLSSEKKKINIDEVGSLILKAGDFAVVTTHERLEMPLDIAGHMGIRSHYTRKGIIPLTGPQIDPGFKGYLIVGLFNASPRDIIIPYKQPFLTMDFIQLTEPATIGYQGIYQNQEDIPVADIEWLAETKGMSFAQVINELHALTINVKSLSESVTRFKNWVTIGLTFFCFVVAMLSIFVALK